MKPCTEELRGDNGIAERHRVVEHDVDEGRGEAGKHVAEDPSDPRGEVPDPGVGAVELVREPVRRHRSGPGEHEGSILPTGAVIVDARVRVQVTPPARPLAARGTG